MILGRRGEVGNTLYLLLWIIQAFFVPIGIIYLLVVFNDYLFQVLSQFIHKAMFCFELFASDFSMEHDHEKQHLV